ncbi:MAG: ABC transporter ATP-binding protein [Alphaproteobacteria bacterium]|jgi:branched-chain amino acid transport system ATP-binding protein|nr:high-affinity branched-chain amino acid ABC transporter ATP-binding protein LivG [Rhodospirillaceae bacterium]MDP6403894.1 ABC transporter ATP-binding protein [Alphaproteobacteria bacterium]MDP6621808.1 ABC transporter ATP-binding protein [Alphaproteobacteria bacterium]|tara:strand:- start:140 stop:907 length:768 start_codon:yes stop_codon:yes gene_type:complete
MLLELQGLSKTFAGLTALSGVSFELAEGTTMGIIGPNGAGKTTLFNTVTGVFPPNAGRIAFQGREITKLAAEKRAALGISRTFQHPRLFKSLTILENVMLGRHAHGRAEFLACGLRLPWARREERDLRARALEYLDLVGLAGEGHRLAGELPLGQQRYLEVARALASEPKLLLLDEPTAGLNDGETEEFRTLVLSIRDRGVTILVIEHHMRFIMSLCDEIVVLNFGQLIEEGTPDHVQRSEAVIEAYLGRDDDDA